jgi:ABC-2 type transport system ATP-binding protein
MPSHLVVRELRKRYGTIEALRGVSFDVQRGETFGLLGPNGAGKTTTLECLAGLRQPDGGEIALDSDGSGRGGSLEDNRDPSAWLRMTKERGAGMRERMGVALQTTALQDKITPREVLRLFGAFYRESETPEVLIERFGLGAKADARFGSLSEGQRQRLALALAFVNRPEIVLLDEPTSGLDPQARRELHDEIRRMKAEGRTVVVATHYLEEAEALCDRIAIVAAGRVIAVGSPRELIARSNAMPSVTLVTSAPIERARLARVPGVIDAQCEGEVARFRTASATQTLATLMPWLEAARVELVELHVQKATLEEVFIGLTRAGATIDEKESSS